MDLVRDNSLSICFDNSWDSLFFPESKLRLVEKFKKFIKSLPEESPQWREIRRLQRI